MSKSHDQRCIDSNRFGDGFDCNCEPDWKALCIAAQTEIQQLEAELRKYEPSDGMMVKLLGLNEAIRQGAWIAEVFRQLLADRVLNTEGPITSQIDEFLARPTVRAAVESAPLMRAIVKPPEKP